MDSTPCLPCRLIGETSTLRLAALFEAGRTQLIERYGNRLKAHQLRAMNAILSCRTGALGQVLWQAALEAGAACAAGNDQSPSTRFQAGDVLPTLPAAHAHCADHCAAQT
jgi:protein involved in temperature-dependent protein secretion